MTQLATKLPLESLEIKRSTLTVKLKSMSGHESNYGDIWDQRVAVIGKINDLHNRTNK